MPALTMGTFSLHRKPPSRFAWLLWLALLLPLAQVAAAAHALSHTVAAGDDDGQRALHQSSCELCLSAAAVSGGALPSLAPALPLSALRDAPPQAAPAVTWFALFSAAYRSRAPPLAVH